MEEDHVYTLRELLSAAADGASGGKRGAGGGGRGPRFLLPETVVVAAASAFQHVTELSAQETNNGQGSLDSVFKTISDGLPELAKAVGTLGQHAPLVGVVFALLVASGRYFAAVRALRKAYDDLALEIAATADLLVATEVFKDEIQAKLPTAVQEVLTRLWADLNGAARLAIKFHHKTYLRRLLGRSRQQAKLYDAQESIALSHKLLVLVSNVSTQVSLLVVHEKIDAVHGKLDSMNGTLESIHDGLKALKSPAVAHIWTIESMSGVFVGRRDELARLEGALEGAKTAGRGVVRIVVTGLPGTGKSVLAQHAASIHEHLFSCGWVLDASNETSLLTGLAIVAKNLGLGDLPQDQLASSVRAQLSRPELQGWLLIVDNVDVAAFTSTTESSPDSSESGGDRLHAQRLSAMLPNVGGCLLVTSRVASWPEGWIVIGLGEMTMEDSTRLLGDDAPNEVAKRLGHLPLALAQAKAFVRRQRIPWSRYLQKLDGPAGTGMASGGAMRQLQVSLRAAQNAPSVAVMLQLLQVLHPDAIPRQLISDAYLACKVEHGDADEALAVLADYSIIALGEETVSVHRLMRDVMLANVHCTEATAYALAATMRTVASQKDDDIQLLRTLLVHYEPLLRWMASERPDSLARAQTLEACGIIYLYTFAQPKLAKPMFDEALRIKRALPSTDETAIEIATTLNNLGVASDNAKDKVDFLEQALTSYETRFGKSHAMVADLLINLGNAYGSLDEHTKKKELLKRARSIQVRTFQGEDHVEVARTDVNLGNAYGDLGNQKRKRELLERALPILRRANVPPNVLASALTNLGDACRYIPDNARARVLLTEALAIDRKLYDPDHAEVGKTSLMLGLALFELHEYEEARAHLECSRQIFDDDPAYAAQRDLAEDYLHRIGAASS